MVDDTRSVTHILPLIFTRVSGMSISISIWILYMYPYFSGFQSKIKPKDIPKRIGPSKDLYPIIGT